MSEQPYASRREVDLLREDLIRMDDHGTRGVGSIQIQLTALVKDVAEMKTNVDARFAAHQRVHDQDQRDRVNGRRWLIGMAIAGLTAMATIITMLTDLLLHVHH